MRKSTAAAIAARRLRVPSGRADHLIQRVSEAGLLPTANGGSIPDLSSGDLANLLLALVADDGLGKAASQVNTFGALIDPTGSDLHSALKDLFSHGPALASAATGALIVRLDPPSASLTASGHHRRFGPEPPPGSAGKHVVVPGQTLAAIGIEFAGHSPEDADALVALARASASASVGLAMRPKAEVVR